MKDKLKAKNRPADELSVLRRKIAQLEESAVQQNRIYDHYRLMYEESIDGYVVVDMEGYIKECNSAFKKNIGYTDAELKQMTFRQLTPAKWHDMEDKIIRELVSSGSHSHVYEKEYIHKDGHVFPVELRTYLIKNPEGRLHGMWALVRDITERKRAENKLRESENKYKTIFENTGTAITILEEDKTISLANTEFEKLTGYSREEIEGKKAWTEFVVKEDMERMAAQHKLRRIDATAAPKTYEFRLVDRAGRIKNIHLNIDMIPGTKKSVASLLDMTIRKQAEDALQESRQLFSDIINFLPDATFVIDNEGKVIAWNLAMEEMTGLKSTDILGKGNYEYALPFYGERRPILIDLVLHPRKDIEVKYTGMERSEEFLEAEVYIPSFRGKAAYLFVKANILRDSHGKIVGAVESIRDITSAKQAEEALKYSEERFSQAFHMNPVPAIICTIEDGEFIDINDSFQRMLHYEREEMIGKTPRILSIWPDVAEQRDVARKLLRQGFLKEETMHLRAKTGAMHDVRASAGIITLNGKKLVLCIFNDVTEQEKLEAQLRQAQKMEAIGTLAGGIAHDFNNILGAVMGYTEMALGEAGLNERLRRYLSNIFRASERARDLVRQILTFSRKGEEKLMSLRVSPIIKEALKLLRASLPSTISINQNIQSVADTVFADPTQIHQILMNLCTNAAYALQDKKGEINISLLSEEINIDNTCGLVPGSYLKLIVRDTGAGMDSATMGRIFDPFFTTKKPGEGTGLGLSLVYGIVKSYGGTITVQSEAGKGTEFSVYIPLLMETEKNPETKAEKSISGGKERILFVDDEAVLVDLGKNILTVLGYAVVGETDSQTALEIFRACPEQFNLVITDMTMPKMTGIELAGKILQIKPEMPVIICTGFSETITLESVKSEGVRDLIMKPFVRRRIAEAVRSALDSKT